MSEAVTSSAGRFPAAPAAADAELLRGARILVVEDEWITAYDVIATLTGAGAVAVGPAATIAKAKQLAANEAGLDAALLDCRLGRDDVLPVIPILAARRIPFVFHTGHASPLDLSKWPDAAIVVKPALPARLVQALYKTIQPSRC
ncbi:MAG: response regulator [Rhodomicrobium sp.]